MNKNINEVHSEASRGITRHGCPSFAIFEALVEFIAKLEPLKVDYNSIQDRLQLQGINSLKPNLLKNSRSPRWEVINDT